MNVLVAGASGGIGGAVAVACRMKGWRTVAVDRADFAKEGHILENAQYDAFVFATGMCPVASISNTTDEIFLETMRVNCGLFLRVVREIVSRRLYSRDGMKIVAVSSVSANEGWSGGGAYCASKGALSALARALDAELQPKGISVEAIEPRYVLTKMFREGAGRMGVPESLAASPESVADDIIGKIERAAGGK